MEINGYTRTCGVFGNPVEHTMSPAIHNTLAGRMGVNLVYVPFHVPSGKIREAVEGAFALNLLGCNVTVPYKSDVIAHLKEMDPLAKNIGAVNTLVRLEDGFKGYNTDMPGLYRAMQEDGVEIEGQDVLILGAGGVARAVAMLLADKKATGVYLLNRTLEKAEQIAQEINALTRKEVVKPMALDDYTKLPDQKFICIQATNVGMFPNTDAAVIEDAAFYEKLTVGYDLVYQPAETKFMKLTEAAGGRAFNGLKMLLWQGVIAYELWTGQKVGEDDAQAAYLAMRKAMGLPEAQIQE